MLYQIAGFFLKKRKNIAAFVSPATQLMGDEASLLQAQAVLKAVVQKIVFLQVLAPVPATL